MASLRGRQYYEYCFELLDSRQHVRAPRGMIPPHDENRAPSWCNELELENGKRVRIVPSGQHFGTPVNFGTPKLFSFSFSLVHLLIAPPQAACGWALVLYFSCRKVSLYLCQKKQKKTLVRQFPPKCSQALITP